MQTVSRSMANDKKVLNKNHHICFVAGKSGGHILPCITLAQQAVNKHPNYKIIFFSTDAALDKQLLCANPVIHEYFALQLGTQPYGSIFTYPRFLWNMLKSFFKSYYYLRKLKPETVITTGGYVAIPVCLAAALLGIPIELYELNVVPGRTIKLLAPLAHKIWICFDKSIQYLPAHKCTLTNYPIKFIESTKIMTKEEALSSLQFTESRKTILILGGSQGSIFINNAVRLFIQNNAQSHKSLQIIHQTGALDSTNWHTFYQNLDIPAIVFSYNDNIGQYYAAADLVICRSGAGTLAEIMFFNKSCITIPLESKTTLHQIDNADAAKRKSPVLITVVRQNELDQNYSVLYQAIKQKLNLI